MSGPCLGHVWAMSGACLGQSKISAVLHASLMPFLRKRSTCWSHYSWWRQQVGRNNWSWSGSREPFLTSWKLWLPQEPAPSLLGISVTNNFGVLESFTSLSSTRLNLLPSASKVLQGTLPGARLDVKLGLAWSFLIEQQIFFNTHTPSIAYKYIFKLLDISFFKPAGSNSQTAMLR